MESPVAPAPVIAGLAVLSLIMLGIHVTPSRGDPAAREAASDIDDLARVLERDDRPCEEQWDRDANEIAILEVTPRPTSPWEIDFRNDRLVAPEQFDLDRRNGTLRVDLSRNGAPWFIALLVPGPGVQEPHLMVGTCMSAGLSWSEPDPHPGDPDQEDIPHDTWIRAGVPRGPEGMSRSYVLVSHLDHHSEECSKTTHHSTGRTWSSVFLDVRLDPGQSATVSYPDGAPEVCPRGSIDYTFYGFWTRAP